MTKKRTSRVGLKYRGKIVYLNVKKIVGFMGFMFKRESTDAVMFNFNKKVNMGIHSFFVFFTFLAVWLDDKNRVVGIKVIKPFSSCIAPQKPISRVVEIPFNKKYKKIIEKLTKP
ncbi:MAG: hypothetical protein WD876_03610 [Candidatus Pacearchaeota archaeon]